MRLRIAASRDSKRVRSAFTLPADWLWSSRNIATIWQTISGDLKPFQWLASPSFAHGCVD
ncbi:hypothetical protein JAO29_00280 [Edaphobacter sp. HDX4]|uniref:hypothetical protein n=1 Tax=Edaphobacter sp. HDX4 TaxID=2794064 RepID=UPI002FE66A04